MERMTERHYKKSDGYYMKCSERCMKDGIYCDDCDELDRLVDRLGAVEDILGDDYSLDWLRSVSDAWKDGRMVIFPDCSGLAESARGAIRKFNDEMAEKYERGDSDEL